MIPSNVNALWWLGLAGVICLGIWLVGGAIAAFILGGRISEDERRRELDEWRRNVIPRGHG